MEIKASLNKYRRSAKKLMEVALLLKGMTVMEAGFQLDNLSKGYAGDLKKLLASAIANAKNNYNLKESDLLIKDLIIGQKPVMKRWRARAHGSAAQILKRTSRIDLVIEETKEAKKLRELEGKRKIKEAKEIEKAGVEVGMNKKRDGKADFKKIGKKVDRKIQSKDDKISNKFLKVGGQAKKIFRRKSI